MTAELPLDSASSRRAGDDRLVVAAVSLTLFLQPILGALFGVFFLGDKLSPWQVTGGLAILAAFVLQTLYTMRRPEPAHGGRYEA